MIHPDFERQMNALMFVTIAFLMLCCLPHPAYSQTRSPRLTGNVVEDVKAAVAAPAQQDQKSLIDKLLSVTIPDWQYAAAMARAANTTASTARAECYAAAADIAKNAAGDNLKGDEGQPLVKPSPDIITKFEQLAEIADNLASNSPLQVKCASIWTSLVQRLTPFHP